MGYSTPKKPFDLGEFLSQKGSVRSGRKPTWQRRSPAAPAATPEAEDAAAVDDTSDEGLPPAAPRKAE